MDTRELRLCMLSHSGFHGYQVSLAVFRSWFVHDITKWLSDCHETKLQAYLTQHHQMAAHLHAMSKTVLLVFYHYSVSVEL